MLGLQGEERAEQVTILPCYAGRRSARKERGKKHGGPEGAVSFLLHVWKNLVKSPKKVLRF
jgi:hypothetical protein